MELIEKTKDHKECSKKIESGFEVLESKNKGICTVFSQMYRKHI